MKEETIGYVIEVEREKRKLFIHLDGKNYTWKKESAMLFDSKEQAETLIKDALRLSLDRHPYMLLHLIGDRRARVLSYEEAKSH
jgi:hypothetical protein